MPRPRRSQAADKGCEVGGDMDKQLTTKLKLFENNKIRTAWDNETEEWYFSIVDVVSVLTEQPDARHAAKYWSVLKTRFKKEGSELPTNCSQLKMLAADGKMRLTDVADTQQLFSGWMKPPTRNLQSREPYIPIKRKATLINGLPSA